MGQQIKEFLHVPVDLHHVMLLKRVYIHVGARKGGDKTDTRHHQLPVPVDSTYRYKCTWLLDLVDLAI